MNRTHPVSVLICTYNARKFLKPTIQSILDQSFKDFELLVLDNNSQDNTPRILKKLEAQDKRIKVFYGKENIGAYPGLNFLIDQASGKYIAINDHDDIWHPKKLDLQTRFLENNPAYVACGSWAINYNERSNKIIIDKNKKETKYVKHISLMFRNKNFRYDTSIKWKTDTYFMRYILSQKSNIFCIQRPLVIHRIREGKGNLNRKWVNIKSVRSYFIKTKDLVKLFSGIGRIISFPLVQRLENIVKRRKVRDITYLKEDEFTKEFLKYINYR